MEMIYKFKAGARPPAGADAQAVGQRLGRLAKSRGGLTVESVTDEAEANPNDPTLGPWFEWNTELAVRKYHEQQAGELIRAIVIVHTKADKSTLKPRAFAYVPTSARYEPLDVVLREPDKRAGLLEEIRDTKRDLDNKLEELLAVIELS